MADELMERKKELERKMSKGLTVMQQRTGCDDREAERLLARWDELNEEYDRVMGNVRQSHT